MTTALSEPALKRSDVPGRLLLAPRNVGCHIVHHIHPQIGLRHLPRLRESYREYHAEPYPSPPTGSPD